MTDRKENILGTKPISRLLPSMALPLVFSMLVQALYYVIDGMYVAQMGTDAFAAVNLVFPIQNTMIGVAVGTAVGVNSVLSRRLGEKKFNEATKVANNGMMLAILSSAVFALIGIFGSEAFMRLSTSDAVIIASGTIYMRICTIFSMGIFVQITTERLLQVTGRTVFQMVAQVTGAITNIILDPILIFGLFGMPELGVAGAAIATVIGQWVGMTICLICNHKFNHETRIKVKHMKLHLPTVKNIYIVGFPSIIMQSIGSFMIFGMNNILISISTIGVVAYGVFFKLMSFAFMPCFGIVSALVPIVGYNYGAQNKKRIIKAIKMSIFASSTIMIVCTIVFWAFPTQLLSLFNADEALYEIGIPMLRIISVSFISAGVIINFSSVFQALGNGMLSLWINVARQLLVILPVAYVMANLFGLQAVWFAFPIAECVSLTLGIVFYLKIYKTRIKPLPDTPPQNSHLQQQLDEMEQTEQDII